MALRFFSAGAQVLAGQSPVHGFRFKKSGTGNRRCTAWMIFMLCLYAVVGCDSGKPGKTDPALKSEVRSGADGNVKQGTGTDAVQTSGSQAEEQLHGASASEPSGKTLSVADASELINQGQLDEASRILTRLLVMRPDDVQVLFLSARLAAQQGDLEKAISLLDEIPEDHPEAGLPALGQAAEWCFISERYADAEKKYRKLLDASPDFVPAIRQLAFLLNRQGRRQEAAVLIRRLCKLGDVLQDELHSLVALRDAMYDAPNSGDPHNEDPIGPERQVQDANARQYYPIAPYGQARKAFQENDFLKVMELLKPSIDARTAPASMLALFGRAACERQDDQAVDWWRQQSNDGQDEFADYWATIGTLELQKQRYGSAARALAEALRRDGTDMESMSRMRQALGSLGKKEDAQRWFDRWTDSRTVLDTNNLVAATKVPDPAAVEQLAKGLERLDRKLEAVLWRARAATSQEEMPKLNQQHRDLVASDNGFPEMDSLWCGTDFGEYPLPSLQQTDGDSSASQLSAKPPSDRHVLPPVFESVSGKVGLQHTYRVAAEPLEKHYSIHQTLGGGVAVLDYDLDGWPDVYFSQGGAGPPDFRARLANQLFRNQLASLMDVSESCFESLRQYTLGVAVGDWNQDGFPDIAVANIGVCELLTNNGDGTFSRRSLESEANFQRVTSSICIADVTSDGLPDIVQVGYVDDADFLAKSPVDIQGQVSITVSPGNFDGAVDCLFESLGDGDFFLRELTDRTDARTGLGVVVADFDDQPGNELFIGNDSLPNRLWKLGRDPQDNWQQVDLASLMGCAYGFSGGATGAMGIAVGDFDRDAKMDFHITNYENESSNLYLRRGPSFQDRNRQFQLNALSRDLVGFGTQSLDYDNDGDLDLVVANGHLDDAQSIRGGFAQPMQLLCNRGRDFELLGVTDSSGYWNRLHVGRSLAVLDYDRDGLTDVVMTNIEQPSALILNRTQTPNHWLQVELVGTSVDRDAVGSEVQVTGSWGTHHAWNVAGDGYMCSNERCLSFGLGLAEKVGRLVIRWPDGKEQTFNDIAADQRILIIQGDADLYQLE